MTYSLFDQTASGLKSGHDSQLEACLGSVLCSQTPGLGAMMDSVADSSSTLDGGRGDAVCAVGAWVIIEDNSDGASETVTTGVDICGVEFTCPNGAQGFGVETRYRRGDGASCSGPPDCLTAANDPQAALGPIESPCEPDSVPSQYVSLGTRGELAVRLATHPERPAPLMLSGCTLRIGERPSPLVEGYRIRVCQDPAGMDCVHTSAGLEILVGFQDVECCACDGVW